MKNELKVETKNNKIFTPLKNKWLIATPEEKVRQEYIAYLVNEYGYILSQMAQEKKVSNSKRGQGRAFADIVVWKNEEEKNEGKSPAIIVECKAEHIIIRKEDYYQGFNYASWAGAEFFVTTNLKDTKFFKVVKGLMPKELEEIVELPYAKDLSDEKKIKELLAKTKAFTREEFSKLLFKCHNIIRNNDKLSPEAAFDEISKILFMKIRYERDTNRKNLLFSRNKFKQLKQAHEETTGKQGKPFYQFLFDQTKLAFQEDEIFDPNETMKIRENSFLEIVKELEKYNLSDTSDDIKGIAFEKFLGRTFRGELGQFFTPRTIVDYMVEVLDPKEGEKICDPACGSGGFLIKAFEYVREQIENDIQATKQKIKEDFYTDDYDKLSEKQKNNIETKIENLFNKLNTELDLKNPKSRLRRLSYECVYGTDANPRMARTAKMNMIMHGDGHGGVHHHDGLLNVNGIFDERFDVIFTNPPFGSRVEKSLTVSDADLPNAEAIKKYKELYGDSYEKEVVQKLQNQKGESILTLFDVGKYSGLTEVLFIERCLRLLKKGGRMGIVLPEGVLNNSALQKVRDYVEGKAKILNITSIPQDVFIASGATIKPSLVFLKKFTEDEEKNYNRIRTQVTSKINTKYEAQIEEIKKKYRRKIEKLKKKGDKDALKTMRREENQVLKVIENLIEEEIRREIKEKFDYKIPIIQVEKAGITSTGAKCENELEEVSVEYKKYRIKKKLWKNFVDYVKYTIVGEKIVRVVGVSEPEIFYQ